MNSNHARVVGSRDPLSDRRIGLYIDFDGLRQVIAGAPSLDPLDVAGRLRELGQEIGRPIIAAVYGDWSSHPDQAREFRRQLIEPRMVIPSGPGDGSTELAISLDAQETLAVGPHLDAFVIVTDDRSFAELIPRLRRADRSVVLVASEGTVVEPAYRAELQFRSIDDVLLGHGRGRVADSGPKVDFSTFDWSPFILLLDELEQNMPFVGFGWLLKKKLSSDNCNCATMQDRQELMDRAVEEEILILYKVDNIAEGADPVTACKLNRGNSRVSELIDS